jgi:hypothetical protein
LYGVGYIEDGVGLEICDYADGFEEAKAKADAMLRDWASTAGFEYRPLEWEKAGLFTVGTTVGKEYEDDPTEHEIQYALVYMGTNQKGMVA